MFRESTDPDQWIASDLEAVVRDVSEGGYGRASLHSPLKMVCLHLHLPPPKTTHIMHGDVMGGYNTRSISATTAPTLPRRWRHTNLHPIANAAAGPAVAVLSSLPTPRRCFELPSRRLRLSCFLFSSSLFPPLPSFFFSIKSTKTKPACATLHSRESSSQDSDLVEITSWWFPTALLSTGENVLGPPCKLKK
jgi:hypothetical protein